MCVRARARHTAPDSGAAWRRWGRGGGGAGGPGPGAGVFQQRLRGECRAAARSPPPRTSAPCASAHCLQRRASPLGSCAGRSPARGRSGRILLMEGERACVRRAGRPRCEGPFLEGRIAARAHPSLARPFRPQTARSTRAGPTPPSPRPRALPPPPCPCSRSRSLALPPAKRLRRQCGAGHRLGCSAGAGVKRGGWTRG